MLAGKDIRLDEHKSYINERTGDIFLRSIAYNPNQKSGVLDMTQSAEWIISGGTITIVEMNQQKSIPIAQLSGVKVVDPPPKNKLAPGNLRLYIDGGLTSQTFLGTGGVSGLSNYSLAFSIHDADIVRKAHDYIAAHAAKNAPAVASSTSIADELTKLKTLVDDGVLTQEEFDQKKSKLLGE